MPAIFERITIDADIDAVFDLIARIEEFPLYADALKSVRKVGRNTYRWVAQAGGTTLEWDSVITEFRRPTRLAWRSIRGFANSGSYTLAPSPAGTLVSIAVEVGFPNRLMETLMAPLVTPLARSLAAEILHRVKLRLEAGRHRPGIGREPAHGIATSRSAAKPRQAGKRG